jgi:hypothetical protein
MKAYTVEQQDGCWVAYHNKEILGVADSMLEAYNLVTEDQR